MGKFKVGDRVRFVEKYATAEVGDEGIVESLWGGGVNVRVGETRYGCFDRRVELVPAWQPKVGDRVRMTREIDGHKTDCPATIIFDDGGTCRPVAIKFDHPQGWAHSAAGKTVDRFGYWVEPDAIEPLPAAAEPLPTFTIEAGKFYKTRDGRKVGPIAVAQGPNDPWPWKLNSGTHYYRNDGHSCPGWADGHRDADDLVAEWVDEPVKASNDNAAPAKFKVGDLIELTSTGYAADVGATAYVRSVRADGMFDIEWVRNALRSGQSDGWYYPFSFKLVTTKPTAIVALIENGQPKPATRPFVHATEEAAKKEADRLAGVHKGQQFGVYVLQDTRETDQPDYGHEWKNLAARGQKIAAIKELRSLTGLNLSAAKSAVEKWSEYELAA